MMEEFLSRQAVRAGLAEYDALKTPEQKRAFYAKIVGSVSVLLAATQEIGQNADLAARGELEGFTLKKFARRVSEAAEAAWAAAHEASEATLETLTTDSPVPSEVAGMVSGIIADAKARGMTVIFATGGAGVPEDAPPEIKQQLALIFERQRRSFDEGVCLDCGKRMPGFVPSGPKKPADWTPPKGWFLMCDAADGRPAAFVCPGCRSDDGPVVEFQRVG